MLNWVDLGLVFEMVEQSHLQGEEQFVIELPLTGVWALHQLGDQTVWDGQFTNISIEIRGQPSYMNGFFGLSGDLKGILVYNASQ